MQETVVFSFIIVKFVTHKFLLIPLKYNKKCFCVSFNVMFVIASGENGKTYGQNHTKQSSPSQHYNIINKTFWKNWDADLCFYDIFSMFWGWMRMFSQSLMVATETYGIRRTQNCQKIRPYDFPCTRVNYFNKISKLTGSIQCAIAIQVVIC